IQRKGSFAIRPGRVTLRYGRPVDVASYGVRRRGELAAEVARRLTELARCERAEEATTVG
ncbi:MAG: hypothetical protein ACRD0X_05790, partial [Thermoanaerobaculia bacterium]